jgi:hypothetical protein
MNRRLLLALVSLIWISGAHAQHAHPGGGRLRETHLRYHLLMMEVLSPEQVSQYNRLRGY